MAVEKLKKRSTVNALRLVRNDLEFMIANVRKSQNERHLGLIVTTQCGTSTVIYRRVSAALKMADSTLTQFDDLANAYHIATLLIADTPETPDDAVAGMDTLIEEREMADLSECMAAAQAGAPMSGH